MYNKTTINNGFCLKITLYVYIYLQVSSLHSHHMGNKHDSHPGSKRMIRCGSVCRNLTWCILSDMVYITASYLCEWFCTSLTSDIHSLQ